LNRTFNKGINKVKFRMPNKLASKENPKYGKTYLRIETA